MSKFILMYGYVQMLHIFTKKKKRKKCQVYVALTCHSAESQLRQKCGGIASKFAFKTI